MPILKNLDENRIKNILKSAGIGNVSRKDVINILVSVYQ
jgi:hypothetical protein